MFKQLLIPTQAFFYLASQSEYHSGKVVELFLQMFGSKSEKICLKDVEMICCFYQEFLLNLLNLSSIQYWGMHGIWIEKGWVKGLNLSRLKRIRVIVHKSLLQYRKCSDHPISYMSAPFIGCQ